MTSRLAAVERDLTALPIAYFLAEADERFSLPVAILRSYARDHLVETAGPDHGLVDAHDVPAIDVRRSGPHP